LDHGPEGDPAARIPHAEALPAAAQAISRAIDAGDIPGAVLCVGDADGIVHLRAFGHRALEPAPELMTADTVFDLASLTKPVATATSVMKLVEEGKLDPDAPVSRYLPEFGQNGKEQVTVGELLLHRGGLIADNHLRDYADGAPKAMQRIWALKLTDPPNTRFRYTDVGYIVLGELVRKVSGQKLDDFAVARIFAPLGMTSTAYTPLPDWRPRLAPTTKDADGWRRGRVHDPRAELLGGVAGHAGLFASAADLARYCRMLLNGGELDGVRVLRSETVAAMTVHHRFDGQARTYGFDADTGYSSARGDRFDSTQTVGHTGFTGPMLWVDPANKVFVIFLCSRLHPDGKGSVLALRRKVATAAAEAMLGRETTSSDR
jgi:CubicO group peptidase (beta-lactamase class C family)